MDKTIEDPTTNLDKESLKDKPKLTTEQNLQQITSCYDAVAEQYYEKFVHELDYKPFDQLFLKSFYEKNQFQGKFIDLGCGPGQTTKFLYDCGCRDLLGVDISSEMITVAAKHFPYIHFETANMLSLPFTNNSIGSAIAFYSIVNFTHEELEFAFLEIFRILRPLGQILFSFHVGDNSKLQLQEFLNCKVDIDFYFFGVDEIHEILNKCHFKVLETVIRYPYHQEHPTKRAYIIAEKSSLE